MQLDIDRLNLKRQFDRAAAAKMLGEMIAIDSVNPSLVPGGAGEAAMAAYVGEVLRAAGCEVTIDEVAPGRHNVVGIRKGKGGGRRLMLVGHLDTVSTAGMTIDPLKPGFSGDRIYGRGSCDMKGGIASILLAMQALAAEGCDTAGDVIVAGVADEEYASIGVEALVGRWHADAGVIAEPTAGGLVVAHKGFAWIDVDVHGRAAHGSDFRQGIDAISHAGHLLAAYDRFHREVLAAVADGIVTRPSVHASLVSGGRELSTYPDHCRVSFERRTVPGEAREDIDKEVADLIDNVRTTVPDFAADATISFYREAYQIDTGEPIVQHLSAAVREVIGQEPSMGGASGWMDSAVMGAAGIPTVIFGPWGEGAHAAVEWVSLASVIGAADVYARLVESFCGRSGAGAAQA